MDLLNNKNNINSLKSNQVEQVQQQKQEYYLLGSFLRTKGLTLYGYNYLIDDIFEVKIKYSDTIHIVHRNGELVAIDYESEKCTIDSRFTYFEALNMRTAKNRVEKYKQGKIDLCNLIKYNPDGINFFNF